MPPTINPPQGSERRRQHGEQRTDLVCRVKYSNTLPDIPFDPKFIAYPFDSNRFIQYNATSLEKTYRHELLAEHDLGISIDLIDLDIYAGASNARLDPADEKLLEEDLHTPQDSKRSARHAKNVSWLRRTEYISSEATRFQPMTIDKVEAKVGYSIKKTLKEEHLYLDRDSQIKAIEKTFEDAKKPVEKHYSKPGVVPVEVLPILPDFKLWKFPCAQVIFDADPAMPGHSAPAQMEEMSQAIIRGVMDETGEQFVAYFLPTAETMEKRTRDASVGVDYADDETYDYKMARQYHWNVKSKASKGYEENYFFAFRDDSVYYNELETRVRLTKRRPKPGEPATSNTRLVVQHRPFTAKEDRFFRQRERNLQAAGQEEEEEDDVDEEEEEEQQSEAEGRKSRSRSRSKSRSKSRSRSRSRSSSGSRSSSPASEKSAPGTPANNEEQESGEENNEGKEDERENNEEEEARSAASSSSESSPSSSDTSSSSDSESSDSD